MMSSSTTHIRRTTCSLRAVFFGTDAIAIPTLDQLTQSYRGIGKYEGLISDLMVVSPGSRPVGRGLVMSDMLTSQYAKKHQLHLEEVPFGMRDLREWDDSVLSGPKEFESNALGKASGRTNYWDVGIVVSFGYFMTDNVLSRLNEGAINLHPSLLPKYRGPAPIPHALLNGDKVTGISIIEIHPKVFDAGRILLQEEHEIGRNETAVELTERLGHIGSDAVMRTLANLSQYRASATQQESSLVTKAPKLRLRHGQLSLSDPVMGTSGSIHNRVRALAGSVGCVLGTYWGKPNDVLKQLRIVRTTAISNEDINKLLKRPMSRFTTTKDASSTGAGDSSPPNKTGADAPVGAVLVDPKQKSVYLRTIDGALKLEVVQPVNKKEMPAVSWGNGLQVVPHEWTCVPVLLDPPPLESPLLK